MCNILPDLVLHLLTFICSPLNNVDSPKCLDFIKLVWMWTHDFSRASFAVDLSANLVQNSICVIDYDYRDMLSIGRDTHMIVKRFGCTAIHN